MSPYGITRPHWVKFYHFPIALSLTSILRTLSYIHIDGSMQEWRNSSTLALELRLSGINPSICPTLCKYHTCFYNPRPCADLWSKTTYLSEFYIIWWHWHDTGWHLAIFSQFTDPACLKQSRLHIAEVKLQKSIVTICLFWISLKCFKGK